MSWNSFEYIVINQLLENQKHIMRALWYGNIGTESGRINLERCVNDTDKVQKGLVIKSDMV